MMGQIHGQQQSGDQSSQETPAAETLGQCWAQFHFLFNYYMTSSGRVQGDLKSCPMIRYPSGQDTAIIPAVGVTCRVQ